MIRKATALLLLIAAVIAGTAGGCRRSGEASEPALAVEYNTHAACAYVAQSKGWLSEGDCGRGSFDIYATGTALAGALAEGSVDAAYICLAPAIAAYANAGVPLKIISGTHRYGYALVVDPAKIEAVEDLEKPGIRVGCVREGGPADLLLHRIIERYWLDKEKVVGNVLRMAPAQQLVAAGTGKIDAAVVPEHFATLAEQELGFAMLVKSQDVWPQMPGSVLIVTEELLGENPAAVQDLWEATSRATDYINEHPAEAAEIVAARLAAFKEAAAGGGGFEITPELVSGSMANLEYTTQIDQAAVQEVIDYMHALGYIKEGFPAADVLWEPGRLAEGQGDG